MDDIQPDGVWITFLGKNHGKSVLRILVQTKDDGAYNFAININEKHEKIFMEEEIKWLVIMGSSIQEKNLLKNLVVIGPNIISIPKNIFLEKHSTNISNEIEGN
ncbi:MAG: hypothetical protein CM1200mP10_04870 [Candidatus Neomarinimicrobiota bacterium]|nr:MAG: hypothetical protein CM1200mP10_04870 [Candidatus Neomarinimicrobiota bacterium]